MLNSSQQGRTHLTTIAMIAPVVRGLIATVLCVWALAPETARADTTIAGDLDFDVPVSSHYAQTGGGFGIRLGQQFHLPLLVVNPEIGFTYASFSDDSPVVYNGPTMYRGIAGARVGVGEMFRFGVLAHIGFGHVVLKPELAPAIADLSYTALTYDAGIFIDFTALPLLNVGVHAIYNRIPGKDNREAQQWMQLGAHVCLVL